MTDIGITKKCNNNCIMCTNIMPHTQEDIPFSEIIEKVRNSKEGSITITGGEPTIRTGLLKILMYINKRNPNQQINLISNGRRFSSETFMKEMKKIKNLKIITELYGSNENLHEHITQTPGSYKQTFYGIKQLLKNGFKVELRVVISNLNYKDIPDLAKLYKNEFKGAEQITLFPIDFIGNANKNFHQVKYTYKEIIPYVEKALDVIPKKTKLYHIPYCVISRKYWDKIEKITVSEKRLSLNDTCKGCKFEKVCPKIWKTYAKKIGLHEFKRITD